MSEKQPEIDQQAADWLGAMFDATCNSVDTYIVKQLDAIKVTLDDKQDVKQRRKNERLV